jgi:hypothetical protein
MERGVEMVGGAKTTSCLRELESPVPKTMTSKAIVAVLNNELGGAEPAPSFRRRQLVAKALESRFKPSEVLSLLLEGFPHPRTERLAGLWRPVLQVWQRKHELTWTLAKLLAYCILALINCWLIA